jgi:hypothetical protein
MATRISWKSCWINWDMHRKEIPMLIQSGKYFFVGDYIDRGPKIKKTLKIVRSMVEDHYFPKFIFEIIGNFKIIKPSLRSK